MNKKILSIMSIIMLVSAIIPTILAFAVSSQYYDNNPLYMKSGETTQTFFTLQNLAGDKDVTVKAEITDGKNIVILLDGSEIYDVPLGEKVKVNFKVTAPVNANVEDKFPITIIFTTVTKQGNNPVAIGSSIGKGFDVIIGEPTKEVPVKTTDYTWLYILGIIIIIVIIAFFIKKKIQKENKSAVRKK